MQVFVSDVLRFFFGIIGLEDDGGLVAAGRQMTVDAVGRDVQGAVLEPLDRDIAGLERRVLNLGEGFDPIKTFCLLAPERLWVIDGCGIHLFVFLSIDVRVSHEFFAGRVSGVRHLERSS